MFVGAVHNDLLTKTIDIETGDVLILPTEKGEIKVELLSLLGTGNTTNVFEINYQNQHMALRLPKYKGNLNTHSKFQDFINDYHQGYEELERQGVSIPKIISYEKDKFLIVEKIDLKESIDLESFFTQRENLEKEIVDAATDALNHQFAKEVAPFTRISDFHLKQVHYSIKERRWFILDWMSSHELFTNVNDPPILNSKILQDHVEKISNATSSSFSVSYKTEAEIPLDALQSVATFRRFVNQARQKILLKEESFIKEKIYALQHANNSQEFLKELNNAPNRFSQNYINAILKILREEERFKARELLEKLPSFLFTNARNYLQLVEIFLTKDIHIHELVQLLSLRSLSINNISWDITMPIQKIITESNNQLTSKQLQILVQHTLVSTYAKNWLEKKSSCFTRLSNKF